MFYDTLGTCKRVTLNFESFYYNNVFRQFIYGQDTGSLFPTSPFDSVVVGVKLSLYLR